MTLTTLDEKTALIVVDLINAIATYPTSVPSAEIFERAGRLTSAFRGHGLPVVLVTVSGGAPGRTSIVRGPRTPVENPLAFVPELDQQPADIVVTKNTWGAFLKTDLADILTDLGVTQVVVCGISTSSGVESTAREAYGHGFNVTLAIDAMTDTNTEVHDNSVERIFSKLGETGTTDEIIAMLDATRK